MKLAKVKNYGDSVINLHAPTSLIRSALGDLKNAEATLRNLSHNAFIAPQEGNLNSTQHGNTTASGGSPAGKLTFRHPEIQESFKALSKNLASLQNLQNGFVQLSNMQKERINNESAVSQFRPLDPFSGRWDECHFSSSICTSLLYEANNLLKEHGVKQHIGFRQLDQSTTVDDSWSNINDW